MVLVMGDCHESIGYRSPAAMGQCHECCGGARGGRLSVRDQGPVGGLRMVAQRPLRKTVHMEKPHLSVTETAALSFQMVGDSGLEPLTSCVSSKYSNQLS